MNIELIFEVSLKKKWSGKIDIVLQAAASAMQEVISLRRELSGNRFHISLLLTNDKEIQQINSEYRGKNKATNVLSFQNIDWDESIDSLFYLDANAIENGSYFYSVTDSNISKIKTLASYDKIIPIGDVIISYERIVEEAIAEKKSFDEHLSFITVHGILHLMGYDHEFEDEATEMNKIEVNTMSRIKINCTNS